MRRVLTIVVLALTAGLAGLTGLPGTSYAGGPTSVLVTQPGADAAALYYDDAAYDALLDVLPAGGTIGKPLPPGGGGTDYHLTWLIHDVTPWRFDRVRVHRDGTAWVSTTFEAGGVEAWEPVQDGEDLAGLLAGVLAGSAAPEVVSVTPDAAPDPAPEVAPPGATPTSPEQTGSSWISLTGWRWLVPGAVLGLLVGIVAGRRRVEHEPRQVLLTSES
jgi:hypothetical protein